MKEKILEWIVALALLGGAWWYAGHLAVENYKAEQLVLQVEADKKQLDKYNKIAGELEELKLTRVENARTVEKKTERIIHNQPIVYNSSCWDDDGLRNANDAIRGGSVSKSATEVRADSTN